MRTAPHEPMHQAAAGRVKQHEQRTKWAVRITFPNGVFSVGAWAADRERAFRLALIDARMANPFGTYDGPVQSWEAVPTG